MSGHSKWSKIKRGKAITDAKRGKIFSKTARIIFIAAKEKGPDPKFNPTLRMAIEKAKEACINSKQPVNEHFEEYLDMIKLGHGAERPISTTKLSRYACYLIMQNADPSKEVVALGQTYFAIQTRRQEIQDQVVEDNKRMFLREEVTAHNKHLAEAASMAGVKNYGTFTNYGYMGLYGGRSMVEIHRKKGLKKSQKILDFMGSEELAANLFRATQTDAKLRRDQIKGEAKANQTHYQVGKKVRDTIKELGGTMPENLTTPDAITQVKKRIKISEKVTKIALKK